ncbi:acyl-CoA dehydrogenase family protein [Pseudonocardia lutea]|uniref:Acyl-CoA dehydrogenase family protein n=1 Tax=Pseudonocardia lutea TaxID=2172015 RepID=A0ABW1IIG7_9PSEU
MTAELAIEHDVEVSSEELVSRARGLRQQLIDDQAAAEERTTYSPELHVAFEEAGFYRMLIPRRFGGLEVGLPTFQRVMIEIGRGSLGAAWGLCLTANHALQVGSWFGEQAQEELLAGAGFRAASVAAPTVRAERVPGGYRLTGQVAYCSGIPYSTHFMGQAVLASPDDGEPTMILYVAPESAFTRLGVWGTLAGLKSTGSDTIRFDSAFVPEHLVIEGVDMVDYPAEHGAPGVELNRNPMYGGRALTIFTLSLAGPIVGGAYSALDEYANWMRAKPAMFPPFLPRTEDPDHQRHYGAALARIGMAEATVLQAAEEWMQLCRDNAAGIRPFTQREDFRLASVVREACVVAHEAVEQELLRTIGSSALGEGQRFERAFRDFGQVAGHRNLALREQMYRLVATLELGVEQP